MIRVRKFPLNERQYKHLLHILTKEEAVKLNDKMRYMREYFGSHYTDAYVKDTTEVYFYYDFLSDTKRYSGFTRRLSQFLPTRTSFSQSLNSEAKPLTPSLSISTHSVLTNTLCQRLSHCLVHRITIYTW